MRVAETPGQSLSTILGTLRSGEMTVLERLETRFAEIEPMVQAFLPEQNRFDRLQGQLRALVARYPDAEDRPPLFGLPVGVKDIFRADGFDTRAGSQLPPQSLVGREAHSLTRLRTAGALVLGKTVTTEFAYFSPGPTRNPHHTDHTPGGSSSGSAAAVAAGLAPLAFGTQTIGSINRPAAYCGVVGFKPTFGRIPTEGVIPLSPSLDHVGFFTIDATGAQAIASILVPDWQHAGAVDRPVLGVPVGPYLEHTSESGMDNFTSVLDRLRRSGFSVIEVPAMSDYEQIADRHRLILAAEAAQVHEQWFAEFEDRYALKTAELIRQGQQISAEALDSALQGRETLRTALHGLMQQNGIDLWLSPAAPGTAPEGLESTGDPALNLPWTHAGLPTITLPSGRDEKGLPFGVQLTTAWRTDEQLLAYAPIVEEVLARN